MIKEKPLSINYQTKTGERFISKGKTAFKIRIHKPDDTLLHRSVGFVRLGEEKALKKAIKLRNELGKQLWGKFWPSILNEPNLITRLPHTLEPVLLTTNCGNAENGEYQYKIDVYQAAWSDKNGQRHCRKYSVNKYGKLAAYMKAKRAMLDAHKDVLELLKFMDRVSTIELK